MNAPVYPDALLPCLMRLAQLHREPVDVLQLQSLLRDLELPAEPSPPQVEQALRRLAQAQFWEPPKTSDKPDPARLPCLVLVPGLAPALITDQRAGMGWVTLRWAPVERQFQESFVARHPPESIFIRLRMKRRFVPSRSPSLQSVWAEIWRYPRILLDIASISVTVTLLAVATSLYSMQVYDRVVPTGASSTLLVLTLGVFFSVLLEAAGKWLRSRHIHRLTDRVDQSLARIVYGRYLQLRLDQLPASVGATASRLRSYEGIRGFLLNLMSQAMVDVPLAMLTLGVLYWIGGALAVVPTFFLVMGLIAGTVSQRRIEHLARLANPAQHFKSGLLVETIEGAETIKSGHGGWRMLSRWLDVTDEARSYELRAREITENANLVIASFQQLAYISLVAIGALKVGTHDLTMGALLACTILSGRVLHPIAFVPGLMMQWANTKVSVQDLDRLWQLQLDHPEGTQPLIASLQGQYQLSDVSMQYGGTLAVKFAHLQIQTGERVALMGSIGSGKTSLLRLLSGMYKPQAGRILLDGMDIELIAKDCLAGHIGFVAQDARLFAGTLRENLVLGMTDPGDDALLQVARRTGLFDAAIAQHPKGLYREINEGGQGLSGGQRQLLHFARAVLRKPTIWLLDEPTASMDGPMEQRVLQTLAEELQARPLSTLVLVTHKPQLLGMVQRLVVLSRQHILFDGPRDAVLQQLHTPPVPPAVVTRPASLVPHPAHL